MDRIKLRVKEILGKNKKGDKLSIFYDVLSVVLILVSVAFILVETFPISHAFHNAIFITEVVIAVIFSIEYLLRIWIAPLYHPELSPFRARLRYIFSFMSLIDLLAIVPVFIIAIPTATGILKIFKLCKIIRLIKVGRYFGGISNLSKALKKKYKEILLSIIVIAVLIVLCSVLLYWAEAPVQPEIFKHGFSGILYGVDVLIDGQTEIIMITTAGKTFIRLIMLLGGCLIGIPLTIFAMGVEEIIEENHRKKEEEQKM